MREGAGLIRSTVAITKSFASSYAEVDAAFPELVMASRTVGQKISV